MVHDRLRTMIAVLTVVVLTAVFHRLGLLNPLEHVVQRLVFPLSRQAYDQSVEDTLQTCQTLGECRQQNLDLQEQLRRTLVTSTTVQLTQEENARLRSQLAYRASVPYTTIGADVIGRDDRISRSNLILNRGAADGVVKGDPIIIDNGVLVGKIARVELHSSVAQLLTDNQSKVAATVMNSASSIGVVEGGYEISVQMNLIPQHETVSIGDMIVTSGLEPLVPHGLLIGRVEAVKKEVYQPFQQAVLTPIAPLTSLTTVSIITHTGVDYQTVNP